MKKTVPQKHNTRLYLLVKNYNSYFAVNNRSILVEWTALVKHPLKVYLQQDVSGKFDMYTYGYRHYVWYLECSAYDKYLVFGTGAAYADFPS